MTRDDFRKLADDYGYYCTVNGAHEEAAQEQLDALVEAHAAALAAKGEAEGERDRLRRSMETLHGRLSAAERDLVACSRDESRKRDRAEARLALAEATMKRVAREISGEVLGLVRVDGRGPAACARTRRLVGLADQLDATACAKETP